MHRDLNDGVELCLLTFNTLQNVSDLRGDNNRGDLTALGRDNKHVLAKVAA